MSSIRSVLALGALTLCAAFAHAQATPAVSAVVAYSISNPVGNLVLGTDGAIYGINSSATSATGGVLYRAAADGTSTATIYQLDPDDAITPQGGLMLGSDGFLYGTTRFGSSNDLTGTGTVFRVATDGTGFQVLHRFENFSDGQDSTNAEGAYPEGELVEGSDGYLYGVTQGGGPNGTGGLFRVARDGTDFDVLHTFAADTDTSTSGQIITVDGASPRGALVQGANGFLYGVASTGGTNGAGTVFRVNPDGSAFEVLHHFTATANDPDTGLPENTDGSTPLAGLADGGDGSFYGVTSVGGSTGRGVVFTFPADGSSFTVLYSFDGKTGARPTAELLLGTDGRLYGTTVSGGVNENDEPTSLGTIFVIDRAGTNFTRLHSFDGTVGSAPSSRLLQLGSDKFLGTVSSGGGCGYGSLFQYSGAGEEIDGDVRCGRRRNNNSGGGAGGPAAFLLLGALAWLRRRPV